MTEKEFEEIKTKIKDKEIENAQAKGKMESIQEMWKNKYGCSSLQEAEDKLKELKSEAEKKAAKRDEYFEKLEKIADWKNI